MSGAELLDERVEHGRRLTLRRRGAGYQILVDGVERAAGDPAIAPGLVALATAPLAGRDDLSVLLVGLGMGQTLRAVLDCPGVQRVDLVEASPTLLDWDARFFSGLNAQARVDPRVSVHQVELGLFLKRHRLGVLAGVPPQGWLGCILELEGALGASTLQGVAALDTSEGIATLEQALRPGGVLTLCSRDRAPELLRQMHARLQNVAEVLVPAELEGQSLLHFVYRGRRRPAARGDLPSN